MAEPGSIGQSPFNPLPSSSSPTPRLPPDLTISYSQLPKNPETIKTNIINALENAKKSDSLKLALRVMGLVGGLILGVMVVGAMAGLMMTPGGWILTAALLTVALVGSLACGGMKEFAKTLVFVAGGALFTFGFGLASSGLLYAFVADSITQGLSIAFGIIAGMIGEKISREEKKQEIL
jgi:hypothetical protein